MSDEELLLRSIAHHAAGVERLQRDGALTQQEFRSACATLYAASDLKDIKKVAALLPPVRSPRLEPLNEVAVREELRSVDCYLERTFPEDYAGFRIVEGGTLVEFGYRSDLRRHIARVRTRVTFPTRVTGFAARFALVDLRYTFVRVSRDWDALVERGIELTSLQLDVDKNAVVIGVEDSVDQANEALRREFGPAIVTQQDFGAAA
jgi:hypothetical protein